MAKQTAANNKLLAGRVVFAGTTHKSWVVFEQNYRTLTVNGFFARRTRTVVFSKLFSDKDFVFWVSRFQVGIHDATVCLTGPKPHAKVLFDSLCVHGWQRRTNSAVDACTEVVNGEREAKSKHTGSIDRTIFRETPATHLRAVFGFHHVR